MAAGEGGEAEFRYPSYVQHIMGDIFSLGFGPFRLPCIIIPRAKLRGAVYYYRSCLLVCVCFCECFCVWVLSVTTITRNGVHP